ILGLLEAYRAAEGAGRFGDRGASGVPDADLQEAKIPTGGAPPRLNASHHDVVHQVPIVAGRPGAWFEYEAGDGAVHLEHRAQRIRCEVAESAVRLDTLAKSWAGHEQVRQGSPELDTFGRVEACQRIPRATLREREHPPHGVQGNAGALLQCRRIESHDA